MDEDGRTRRLWPRAVAVYVGLFVLAGALFGAFHGVTERRGIVEALVAGVVFGSIMSAVLGTVMVVGQRGNRGSWSPRRTLTLTMPDTAELARRQTLVALRELGAQVTLDEPGRVSARTGFSMKSWGNRIDVAFDGAPGATTVHVAVRPRVRTTLIDYGASNHVIEVLRFFLTPQPY